MRAWWILIAAACTPPPSDGPRAPGDDDLPSDTDDDPDPDPTEPTDPGTTVTESFTFVAPLVDVLFVIDASSSMWSRIDNLVGAMVPLLESWDSLGIDYHAGATDIDESPVQGQLTEIDGHRWSDPSHPNPGTLLRQLINAVEDPSTEESGSLTTYRALRKAEPGFVNEGFLRDGSQIAVVLFTDEADQSPTGQVSKTEIIDYMVALRPEPDDIELHAIVATEDYVDLATAVGGIVWNVDNIPYGPVLEAITDTIERRNVFTLSGAAVEDSIVVRIEDTAGGPVELSGSEVTYDADEHTVDLEDYAPDSGATVEITYLPLD